VGTYTEVLAGYFIIALTFVHSKKNINKVIGHPLLARCIIITTLYYNAAFVDLSLTKYFNEDYIERTPPILLHANWPDNPYCKGVLILLFC